MNPVAAGAISAALVVLGKWSRGQTVNADNVIGIVGIIVGLAIIEQMEERMSKAFAVLIVVSLASAHFPHIVKALGLTK